MSQTVRKPNPVMQDETSKKEMVISGEVISGEEESINNEFGFVKEMAR